MSKKETELFTAGCGMKKGQTLLNKPITGKTTKIKGQYLHDWENWIKEELSPPIKVSEEVKYTLEAFLELIEFVKNGK